MKKLIDCFRTILLISSFFTLDRHPPFFEIKFKERRNKMKLFDYKGRDFKEIRIDNNEKKYFLSLLVNRGCQTPASASAFLYRGRSSTACAAAKDDAVVSLESEEGFREA